MPTIGVAIAIPEPWATKLQDYRTSIGDTTAVMIPTHLTLIPPTEIEDSALPAVEEHLDAARRGYPAFDVLLRGTGTFRPVSPVVFVAVAEGIAGCEQLAKRVRSGPLDVTLNFPFHPHVTIAHHLDDEALDRAFDELADFECQFVADGFYLYVHENGTGWRPRRRFDLDD